MMKLTWKNWTWLDSLIAVVCCTLTAMSVASIIATLAGHR